MRKMSLIVFAIVLTLFISSPTYSGDGVYLSGNIGLAATTDSDLADTALPSTAIGLEFESGLIVGGAIGYRFRNLGLEGEITFQTNDLDKVGLLDTD